MGEKPEPDIVKGEPVALAWSVPKEQRLIYTVTPTNNKRFFSARAIGKQLEAIAKLLEIENNRDDSLKWMTGISAAYTRSDGSFCFELIVMPKKDALKAKIPTPTEQG